MSADRRHRPPGESGTGPSADLTEHAGPGEHGPDRAHGSGDATATATPAASAVPPGHAKSSRRARCLVVTVSDTRSLADDPSGDLAASLLASAGHVVLERRLVRDDRDSIEAVAREAIERHDVDAVVFTGGTGIAPRDLTPEALAPLLAKPLDGFGEAFRQLSFEEIGPRAVLSRAVAGVTGQTIFFALPGSTRAVALGVERLILPLLPHAVDLITG